MEVVIWVSGCHQPLGLHTVVLELPAKGFSVLAFLSQLDAVVFSHISSSVSFSDDLQPRH